jgi:hypothetical protein
VIATRENGLHSEVEAVRTEYGGTVRSCACQDVKPSPAI